MAAIACSRWDTAKLLLDEGADVARKDVMGATLIDYAEASRADASLTARLVEKGARRDGPSLIGKPDFTDPAHIELRWNEAPVPGQKALSPGQVEEYERVAQEPGDVTLAIEAIEFGGACFRFLVRVENSGPPMSFKRWGCGLLVDGNEYHLRPSTPFEVLTMKPADGEEIALEPSQHLGPLTSEAIPTGEAVTGWLEMCSEGIGADIASSGERQFLFTTRPSSGGLQKFVAVA